jgi:hypothetical protein
MLAKFAEATRLLCTNLVLFSSIILTVWLPGNVFTNYLAYVPITFLIYVPLDRFPELDTMATGVALDCALDIAFAPIQIVMFLYYWHAVERAGAPPPAR